MISISKSALELLINRITSIQNTVASFETELTNIKKVCEQWTTEPANEKQNNRDVNIIEPNTCATSSKTDTKEIIVDDDDYISYNTNLQNHLNKIRDKSLEIVSVEVETDKPELVDYIDLTNEESLEIKPPDPKTVPDCIEYIDLTIDEKSETEVIIIRSNTSESRAILNVDANNFTIDKDGYVWVYTDGSYYADGRGGIGVWFGFGHPLNLSKSVKVKKSGETEIIACIEAVKQAHVNNIKKLCVNTDYLSIVNLMQGNVKTKPGKESCELIKTNKLLDDVKYRYVKSHSGITGNNEADRLAKLAARNMKIDRNNNLDITTRNKITGIQPIQQSLIEKTFKYDSDRYVTVFIKGVRCINQKFASIAVWFNDKHHLNLSEILEHSSNLNYELNGYNGAEVLACNIAILRAHAVGIKKLCIYSDSANTVCNIKSTVIDTKQNNKIELYELDKTMKLIPFLKWTYTKGAKGSSEAFTMANKYALVNEQINNISQTASTIKGVSTATIETNNATNNKSLALLTSVLNSSLKRKRTNNPKQRKKRKLNNSTAQSED